MAVIPTPSTPHWGFLLDVAYRMYDIGVWFRNTGNSFENVFLLDDWLQPPFLYVSGIFIQASYRLSAADASLAEWIGWLRYVVDGVGFLNLLYWASESFRLIRENPQSWLRVLLYSLTWWLSEFILNPTYWLSRTIREVAGHFGLLIDNPVEFVNQFIRGIRWFIGLLLDNPRDFIIYFLTQLMPNVLSFLLNPYSFIIESVGTYLFDVWGFINTPRDWIKARLAEFVPELYGFLDNPDNWVKNKVSYLFGLPLGFWNDPFYWLIRLLLENLRGRLLTYIDTIKEIAVDIILYFI